MRCTDSLKLRSLGRFESNSASSIEYNFSYNYLFSILNTTSSSYISMNIDKFFGLYEY